MVDSKGFSERLKKIMEYHDLNASTFADSIKVGRSSISHILSGRNKPSLDFVLSVTNQFKEVDLYWLLNGSGHYPTYSNPDSVMDSNQPINTTQNQKEIAKSVSESITNLQTKEDTQSKNSNKERGKNISKIIILYDDGSFENFNPSS
jgi:transcriptional regulator with XRE-family HTH domain